MWMSISIFVALVILSLLAYLYTAAKDKPITVNERYMLVYEDGLLDLIAGLFLISAGVMLNVNPGLMGIFIPLLYVVFLTAKTAITKPRLDPAALPTEVAKQRQLKLLLLLGLALFVGIVAFLLFAADISAVREGLTSYFAPTLVLGLTALLTLWAYRTGVRRLYLYAALVLAVYGSSFWLAISFSLYLVTIGMGMLLIGLSVTARFVYEHPKLSPSG